MKKPVISITFSHIKKN